MKLKNEPLLQWVPKLLNRFPDAKAYVVGGAVRDELRGAKIKDIDMVVGGVKPEDLEVWLSNNGQVNLVGRRFSVWKFSPFANPENPEIDIALPRSEVAEGDSGGYRDFKIEADPNLPIEDDLSRRDFTINAMAYDLRNEELIDPHGGKKDLRSKIIRTVGDPSQRLKEDSTRILRALRFAVLLNGTIEGETLKAIKQNISRLNLKSEDGFVVAREMVGQEFTKTFLLNPIRCLEFYKLSGAWNELFGDHNTEKASSLLELVTGHEFSKNFDNARSETLFAAMLWKLLRSSSLVRKWMKQWHMQVDTYVVTRMIQMTEIDPRDLSMSEVEKKYMNSFDNLVQFTAVMAEDGNEKAGPWLETLTRTKLAVETHPAPLLTGEDLKEAGITPGPIYTEILSLVRRKQLSEEVLNKEEALRFAKSVYKNYSKTE